MTEPKILIVSDIAPFSTIDVFTGILDAFSALNKTNVTGYSMLPLYNYKNMIDASMAFSERMLQDDKVLLKNKGMSDKHVWSMAFAEMMNPKYDYILFVAATCVPEFIFENLKYYGKKIVVWATDDPHSTGMLERYEKYIDLYFTNERTLSNYFPNKTHYVPMAAPCKVEIPIEVDDGSNDSLLAYDIVFIGSVYPNRVKLLEKVCRYAKDNDLKLLIKGHTSLAPKNSIIHKYGVHGSIDSKVTRWYYRRSKVCINIDRDPSWSPTGTKNKWRVEKKIEPESTNPRLYEIPLLGSLQVYIDPRQEAKDLLPNLIYCREDNVEEILSYALKLYDNEYSKILNNMKSENYNIVSWDHTYINRAIQIESIINKDYVK